MIFHYLCNMDIIGTETNDPCMKQLCEMFHGLNVKGWRKSADLPRLDDAVPAGVPSWIEEEAVRSIVNLRIEMGAKMLVPVRGDSMTGAGIDNGDDLEVVITPMAQSGDVVVANVDGQVTVKTFIIDEYGEGWLAPHNPEYQPIRLRDYDNVHIVGQVTGIRKRPSRAHLAESLDAVRKAQEGIEQHPTKESIARALREVESDIKYKRMWFCIYRVLADHGKIDDTDFHGFISLIEEIMGNNAPILDAKDLSRINTDCFAKDLTRWRADDTPVGITHAHEYIRLARRFERELLGRRKER